MLSKVLATFTVWILVLGVIAVIIVIIIAYRFWNQTYLKSLDLFVHFLVSSMLAVILKELIQVELLVQYLAHSKNSENVMVE